MTRTAKLLLVALGVGIVIILLATVSVRASTLPAEVTDSGPMPVSFTAQATGVRTSSCAHGWTITLDKRITNTYGNTSVWPAMDVFWCGGAQMQKVTNLIDLACYNKGGFFTYDGCSKSHGKLGYSYLSIHGDWRYHWVINGLTFAKTPSLDAKLYPNGVVTGTWYYFN